MLDHNNLSDLIKNKRYEEITLVFEDYNVVSMAEIVSEMSIKDILFLLKFLPKNIGGDLFASFESERKSEIIESLSDDDVKKVFDNFYADDIISLLGELPANLTKKILEKTSKETRADINTILDYQSETAGAIMTVEFVELKANDTYKDALDKVKKQGSMAEVVTECFIVNENRVLQGKIKLKDLIFGEPDEIVADNMETNIITVATQADQEVVLTLMQKYDLHLIPVVNPDYCLVGIVTIDDILDIMEREVTRDVHQMAGISATEESYINSSIWQMAKARTPWLMILMFTALFTEMVLKIFENELASATILAAFIPMTMGTAGNAANQSSVTVIRGIVVDGLNVKDASKIFFKEIRISLYLSVTMFIVTILRLYLLPPAAGLDVILSISISIVISLFVANVVGGLLPILALYLKQDPAAMAAPIVSNIMDVSSLAIFFLVAKVILRI